VLEPLAPVLDPLAPVVEPLAPVLEPLAPVLEPAVPILSPVLEPSAPILQPPGSPPVQEGALPGSSGDSIATGGSASEPVATVVPSTVIGSLLPVAADVAQPTEAPIAPAPSAPLAAAPGPTAVPATVEPPPGSEAARPTRPGASSLPLDLHGASRLPISGIPLAPKVVALILGGLAALVGALGVAAASSHGSSDQHGTFAALVAPLRLVVPGLGRWLRPLPVLARPPVYDSLLTQPG
jgi:hypothetical protein